jgi:hypothetical protein
MVAEHQGDNAEATRQYPHDEAARGDYGEAVRQYQRTLDIRERLGDPVGIARSCHNLGVLETGRGSAATAIGWYVRALVIRLQLGVREHHVPARPDGLTAWSVGGMILQYML